MKHTSTLLSLAAVVCSLSFAALSPSLSAATLTWNGSSDGYWSTAANWSGNVAPVDGDSLRFPPTATTFLTTNNITSLRLNTITFGEGEHYTLAGNSITLTSGMSAEALSYYSTHTIYLPITCGASQTFACAHSRFRLYGPLNLGPFTLTVELVQRISLIGAEVVIVGISGTGDLIMNGSGEMSLFISDNTFTGNMVANGGQLTLVNQDADSPGGGVFLNGRAVLALSGFLPASRPLTLNSTAPVSFIVEGACVWNNTIVLEADSTIDVMDIAGNGGDELETRAVISGRGKLIKTGLGKLLMSGSSANTYTNLTWVKEGTLELATATGNSIVGPLEIGENSASDAVDVVARLLTDTVIGDVPVTIRRSGLLDLNDYNDGIGALTLVGGNVRTGTGQLTLGGDLTASFSPSSVTSSISGHLNLGGVIRTVTVGVGSPRPNLLIGAVVSNGGIVKEGGGTLLMTAANTYSGVTIINDGILLANYDSALGNKSAGTIVNDGGTLWIGENVVDLAESLTLYGNGFSGTDGALVVAGTTALTGSISGTGGLSLLGGAVELGGTSANTFTGTTFAHGELLKLNKPTDVRALSGPLVVGGGTNAQSEVRWLNNLQLSFPANVTVHANGLVSLAGFTEVIDQLTFNGGHVNLGVGGVLSLTSDVVANPADTTALIDGGNNTGALFLSGQRTFDVGNGASSVDLQIDSRIYGDGLNKAGPGTLLLGGNNAFPNPTVIFDGILIANHNNALGSTSGGTTVNDGATLELGANVSNLPEPLTLNGTGFGGTDGALAAVGVTTASAHVVLQSPSTIRTEDSAQFSLSGVISGTGPLTKTGAGLLLLGGSSENNYTGDTLVKEGLLFLNKSTDVICIPGHLVIGGSGASARVTHLTGSFTVNGSITVNRNGLYDLGGWSESFSLAQLGGRPPLTLNDGGDVQTANGRLLLPAGTAIVVEPGFSGSSSISGRLSLEASLAFGGNHTFAVNSPISAFASAPLTISGSLEAISGTAHVIKTGSGEMRLSGNNTYAGQLAINGGRVTLANSGAVGAPGGGVIVSSNAVLGIDGSFTFNNESLTLNSTAPAQLTVLSGASFWNGTVTLSRDTTINVNTNASLEQRTGISGAGTLTKFGPGALILGGSSANTYSNTTWVKEGDLLLNNTAYNGAIVGPLIIGDGIGGADADVVRLDQVRQIGNNVPVTINSSGLLDLNGQSDAFGALSGNGHVNLNGGILEANYPDATSTFSGVISGAGDFYKDGTGTLALNGDNTYTGTTVVYADATVGGGTLVVNGSQPQSAVVVSNGCTLGGDGVVGDTTVHSGGLLAPSSKFRDHQGGELETGDLNLKEGAVLSLSYFGPNGPGGNDSVAASGGVKLMGATLGTGFFYAPRQGDVLPVITKRSAGPVTGTFSGRAQGTITLVNNIPCLISYTGGDGNDVTLTVTNLALGASRTRVESGNGNALVDPAECNLIFLTLTNRRNTALSVSSAVLRSLTPGAVVTIAQAAYPIMPTLGTATNATPFQLRTLPDLVCGGPVTVELQVTVTGEGTFAVLFTLPGGTDCFDNGGGCESCMAIAGGHITNGLPTLAQRLYRTADPSGCFPRKKSPGPDVVPNNPVRYATHFFTNATANEICLTALLKRECATAAQTLMAVAFLDAVNPANLFENYIGDTPGLLDGLASPFSFRVPAGSRFVIIVNEINAGLGCPNYTLELFGLPCPSPALHIATDSAPAKVRFHWSTAYPGWQLQSVNTINGPSPYPFANVSASPVVVNSQYTVTNNTPSFSKFYRLKQ